MVAPNKTEFDYKAVQGAARAVCKANLPLVRQVSTAPAEVVNDLVSLAWEAFNAGKYDPAKSLQKTWATMFCHGRLIDLAAAASTRKEQISAGVLPIENIPQPPDRNWLLPDANTQAHVSECIESQVLVMAERYEACNDSETQTQLDSAVMSLQLVHRQLCGEYLQIDIGNRSYTRHNFVKNEEENDDE